MLLSEFLEAYPSVEKGIHDSGAVYVVMDKPVPQLWNLKDYKVSTCSGIVYWLMPVLREM